MLLEMHCHTSNHSRCSSVDGASLLSQLSRDGLQGVVLTDHHFLWSDQELRKLKETAGVPDHFVVLAGQEVSTGNAGDVLVYGADRAIAKGTRLADIRAKYPLAALVLAHPYRNGSIPTENMLLNPALDGIEIFSSNHSVTENARGLRDWHRYKFTALAGTDTHGLMYAGFYPTLFDHPLETIEQLAQDLKHGRCHPFFKEIPRVGATNRVDEIIIGTKQEHHQRERLIIRELASDEQLKSAGRASHIMEQIASHGFDRGRYRVPRMIDRNLKDKVLIEESIRGSLLFNRLLKASPSEARFLVELSARWLARLHNRRLQLTPAGEFLEKEPRRLARYVQRFQKINHPHTGRARDIMRSLWQAENRLVCDNHQMLVQAHGDYHPKNILIGQDDPEKRRSIFVAVIDFSSSYRLPPAFDVGTFLAQFKNQFIDYPNIRRMVPEETFMNAYLTAADNQDSAFLNQVELFRARTDLSIAAYLIKVGLGGSENLWRLLVEAETVLVRFGYLAQGQDAHPAFRISESEVQTPSIP